MLFAGHVIAQNEDQYDLEIIISEINSISAPYIKGNYIIFTAQMRSRHVGISFDFEQFRVIHSYQRIDTRDTENMVISSLYFYALRIPDDVDSVSYKIITDGLWSIDPLNPNTKFDSASSSVLSTVQIYRDTTPATRVVRQGIVHFVYQGRAGQKIQLGGSFTNWDPFIYEMRETSPGFYECELPFLPGTYYYNFYNGMTAIVDPTNSSRAYTTDGRTASVLVVR
jgi:hypothetical protein